MLKGIDLLGKAVPHISPEVNQSLLTFNGLQPLSIDNSSTATSQNLRSQKKANGLKRDALRGFDLATIGNIASSEDFDLHIEYAPRLGSQGYIFKVQLSPREGIKFKRISQNLFFLIDRSHSIRHDRFELTKQAVANALYSLHPGDTFNVLFFDENIERFATKNVSCNPMNVER